MTEASKELVQQCLLRIRESEQRITTCLNTLSLTQVWQKPNQHLSAIGNLVHHVCGNMTQYMWASLGQNPDLRTRDLEFSITAGDKTELLNLLSSTCAKIYALLEKVSEHELMRERNVQGFRLTGIGILIHVTEHLSYHTGQITFYTKLLLDKDLGYYSGLDLNLTT